MKISIIIPCYNIEKHIEKCIDSVLNQTFSDFELLLLDDGSTDQTLAILKKCENKDQRIKVFTHANQGVSYTRNKGVELSVAEFIMFIDGDDYVKADFLEQHFQYASPEVWPISGMVNVTNEISEDNVYFKKLLGLFPNYVIKQEDILKVLQYYSFSSPCCRVYSKKILNELQIKFNEEVSYQEDLLFNLDYVRFIKSVQLINYYGYFYVQHDQSSSLKFHENFGYNKELFGKLVSLIKNKQDHYIVHEFIFQTFMKRISNIFHKDSGYTKEQIMNELKVVFNDQYFTLIRPYIYHSKVNRVLKNLLFLKSKNLLYYYYKAIN